MVSNEDVGIEKKPGKRRVFYRVLAIPAFLVFLVLGFICYETIAVKMAVSASMQYQNSKISPYHSNLLFNQRIWSKAVPQIIDAHTRAVDQTTKDGKFTLSDINAFNRRINTWNCLLDIAENTAPSTRRIIEEYCTDMLKNNKLEPGEKSNYENRYPVPVQDTGVQDARLNDWP